jgi:hypothetical protein
MGVAGSGKTTVGKLLAERLDLAFYDADDFHPPVKRVPLGAVGFGIALLLSVFWQAVKYVIRMNQITLSNAFFILS